MCILCSIIAYTIQLYFVVMEVWTLGFVPTKELFVISCFRCQQNNLNVSINYNLKSIGILKRGILKGKIKMDYEQFP